MIEVVEKTSKQVYIPAIGTKDGKATRAEVTYNLKRLYETNELVFSFNTGMIGIQANALRLLADYLDEENNKNKK